MTASAAFTHHHQQSNLWAKILIAITFVNAFTLHTPTTTWAHPVYRENAHTDYWQNPCPAEQAAIAFSAAMGTGGGDGALELAKALELTASVISSAHELRNDAVSVLSEMLGGDLTAADQLTANTETGLLGEINAKLGRTGQPALGTVVKEYKNLLEQFARELSTMYQAEQKARGALSTQLERLNFGSSGLRTLLCAMTMLEMHLQPAGSSRSARSLSSSLRSDGGSGNGGGNGITDAALAAFGANIDKIVVLKGMADALNSMVKNIENSVAKP